jgi:hypothetical protein
MKPFALLLLATVALVAPATADAQQADRGTTRTTFRTDGITLRTSTARDGAVRCVAVPSLGRACSPRGVKEGALFVGHVVTVRRGAPTRLGRLVIAGLGGDRARRVRVRWRNRVTVIEPRRFGAYLAVLGPSARQRDVVITMRHADGSSNSIDYRRTRPRFRPVAGSERVDLRLDDPLDGSPLGLLTWRAAGGQRCQFLGDLVGGRVGHLRGRVFTEYPINDGGSCGRPDPRTPVSVSATWSAGRGSVTGFARSDVVRLELRTPASSVPLRVTRRRAFAHAFRHDRGASPPQATLVITLADGTRTEQPLGGAPPPA